MLPRLGQETNVVAPTTTQGDDDVDFLLGVGACADRVHRDTKPTTAPVWQDSDDEDIQVAVASRNMLRKLREQEDEVVLSGPAYEQRLRAQHSKLNPRAATWAAPKHALPESNKHENIAEALLTRAGGLITSSTHRLPPTRLETTRLKDANQQEPATAVIRSVEFHPNGQLLMTASMDRHLRFFSVDGIDNPKVQSIFLEDMPVQQAAFAQGGAQVIASGRRSFFYVLDLETAAIERVNGIFGRSERSFESFTASPSSPIAAFFGRDGTIPLVSLQSRQLTATLQMNGSVRAGAFSADGKRLMTTGGDGMVYTWDLRMNKCVDKWVDEGSIGGVAVAWSPDPTTTTFAVGSSSGIVNVYRRDVNTSSGSDSSTKRVGAALKPTKALTQLTTTADTLSFNSDGQLLAIASRMKRDSLRLVHVPTMTVFSNWPTSKTPLHYVHSVGFSPGSGYIAVGNAKGRVVLYRLHHYSQS